MKNIWVLLLQTIDTADVSLQLIFHYCINQNIFYYCNIISNYYFLQLLYMLLYMFRMWALKGKLATRHFSTAMNQRFALCSCFWLKSCPERVQRPLTSLQVCLTTDFFNLCIWHMLVIDIILCMK